MSRPVNTKKTSVLTWLPWLLLVALLVAFAWLFTSYQSEQDAAWQPPRAEPVQQETQPPTDTPAPVVSYHDAVARASQSVVNIYTTQVVNNHPYMDDPVLRRFFEFHGGMPEQEHGETNLGSGVIVSQDGYIVTNAHVIEKADEITVSFNDGRRSRALIIGTDPDSDLAVIKVDMTGLTPLAFRSKPIEVGDIALAIGNPFGVGQTVTQGIISATGRTGLGVNKFEDFIQTDAAINPGNSGGALVDAYGQLVGINTLNFSRSVGSMGIGFAIPTSLVEQVMNALIKDGRVRRGWLGIEIQSKLRDPTQLDTTTGVEVLNVIPESPSAKSGLQVGDVILSIDGVEMTDANTLIQYVARKAPDTVLNAQVLRTMGNKQVNKQIQIILTERPPQETVEAPLIDQPYLEEPSAGERLDDSGNGTPMTEEERLRLREELMQLFEKDAARNQP